MLCSYITGDYCSPLDQVDVTSFNSTAPDMAGALEGDTFNITCAIGYEFEGDGVCTCDTDGVWSGSCNCTSEYLYTRCISLQSLLLNTFSARIDFRHHNLISIVNSCTERVKPL